MSDWNNLCDQLDEFLSEDDFKDEAGKFASSLRDQKSQFERRKLGTIVKNLKRYNDPEDSATLKLLAQNCHMSQIEFKKHAMESDFFADCAASQKTYPQAKMELKCERLEKFGKQFL